MNSCEYIIFLKLVRYNPMVYCSKDFIGKKFKEFRKKAKLTQEEVSEKAEIDEKHYGKLERGIFSPSIETFFKIVKILKIPLNEFGISSQKNDSTESEKRKRLLKEIYLFSEKETDFILDTIKSLKKFAEQ